MRRHVWWRRRAGSGLRDPIVTPSLLPLLTLRTPTDFVETTACSCDSRWLPSVPRLVASQTSDFGVVVFQTRILQLLWAWKFSLTVVERNALWLLLHLLSQKSIAASDQSLARKTLRIEDGKEPVSTFTGLDTSAFGHHIRHSLDDSEGCATPFGRFESTEVALRAKLNFR